MNEPLRNVILSPGGAKATTLSVTHHCDANSGAFLPFTLHYKATITGGNFVADYVSPGSGAESTLEVQYHPMVEKQYFNIRERRDSQIQYRDAPPRNAS